MKKTLIVYYSLTGNTKFISEAIKEALNSDILELKPVKELKAEGSSKFFWGGAQAIMKKKPKLESFDISPLDYDLIFIGTPIWAGRFSPPIRSFLSKFDLSGKNLALWMCCGGDGQKSMEKFKENLSHANIISTNWFKEPLQQNSEDFKERAITWAKEVEENLKHIEFEKGFSKNGTAPKVIQA